MCCRQHFHKGFEQAIADRLQQRFDDKQPLSTTLFPSESTVEFTTRLAKLLARRVQLPVYVTNSMSFANAGMGGTIDEEMEAFKNIAEVTTECLRTAGIGALALNLNSSSTT